MRKGFNLVAGAVAMAVSGSAFAAHPAFKQWNADAGTIGGYCQTGYSCDVIASGDGFVQFMTKDEASGETYVGTIVTDSGADTTAGGIAFSDESYIKMEISTGGTTQSDVNGGIAGVQSISETSAADGTTFTSDVTLQTGTNFAVAGAPTITIQQTLVNDNDNATMRGDDFMSDFLYMADTDGTGQRNGFIMEIDQSVGLYTPTDDGSSQDIQAFTYREAAGTRQGGSGTLTVPGSSLTYAAQEDVKAIWLGQEVNIGMSDQTGTGLGGSFSYISYENKGIKTGNPADYTDGSGAIFDFDLTSSAGPDAADWDSTFNLTFPGQSESGAPTLDDPSGGRVATGG